MAGWQRDYYFSETTSDKLLYILTRGANIYENFKAEVEKAYLEITSFHTDEFSVYLTTSDERFEEIKRGVLKIINKKYKELLNK